MATKQNAGGARAARSGRPLPLLCAKRKAEAAGRLQHSAPRQRSLLRHPGAWLLWLWPSFQQQAAPRDASGDGCCCRCRYLAGRETLSRAAAAAAAPARVLGRAIGRLVSPVFSSLAILVVAYLPPPSRLPPLFPTSSLHAAAAASMDGPFLPSLDVPLWWVAELGSADCKIGVPLLKVWDRGGGGKWGASKRGWWALLQRAFWFGWPDGSPFPFDFF